MSSEIDDIARMYPTNFTMFVVQTEADIIRSIKRMTFGQLCDALDLAVFESEGGHMKENNGERLALIASARRLGKKVGREIERRMLAKGEQ